MDQEGNTPGEADRELLDGDFRVEIVHEDRTLWSHREESGQRCGLSNRTYRDDGMAGQIVRALAVALRKAAVEAGLDANDLGGVWRRLRVEAEIAGDLPVTTMAAQEARYLLSEGEVIRSSAQYATGTVREILLARSELAFLSAEEIVDRLASASEPGPKAT